MFNKKKPNLETIQNLKNYFIKKYEIPESTILSIAELNCHEPDCPPTETVITARSIDGSTKNWKIHKPIDEISENDINDCLLYTSPSPRDYAASRMPSSA